MKPVVASISLLFALASASNNLYPHFEQQHHGSILDWKSPGPNDFRGPCPMLNTLANHGFLPHDGRNITEANAVYALTTALNFNRTLAARMWEAGVVVNPEPNATFFTLEQLGVHNILEHDASLSRADALHGSNVAFNETIFNETRLYWIDETLNMDMLANAKLARQIESRAFNPTYTFTSVAEGFSRGEVSSFVLMFGDIEAGTANRTLLEYLFVHEKLPTDIGWTRPNITLGSTHLTVVGDMLAKALTLLTDTTSVPTSSRRDPHFGFDV